MTVPQHMVALAKANRVRLAQSALKHEIRNGELSIADALKDDRAATIAIFNLLRAQHRWGVTRARQTLRSLDIGELKPVGALTDRQRRALVAELDRRDIAA